MARVRDVIVHITHAKVSPPTHIGVPNACRLAERPAWPTQILVPLRGLAKGIGSPCYAAHPVDSDLGYPSSWAPGIDCVAAGPRTISYLTYVGAFNVVTPH